MTRLDRLLSNLGYGSRTEVATLVRKGRITVDGRPARSPDLKVDHGAVRFEGEPLDPPEGMVLMLNKPIGFSSTTSDPGRIVYEFLPGRFGKRKPPLSCVGRLDKDTSGLLLMTDDGPLLHRIISPKKNLPKVYEATLARPLNGTEAERFSSGTLMLESETTPLKPARLEVLNDRHVRLTITEGRYHQVRRMFAAVGNHVETLHRLRIGSLELDGLEEGKYRLLGEADVARIFIGES
ncbi:MAG TPA: pseudouridine synthase [Tepidisphaeraceae bacterium]|nr:pseudouridine synthase [Tepidisphaeraceae bacterium]